MEAARPRGAMSVALWRCGAARQKKIVSLDQSTLRTRKRSRATKSKLSETGRHFGEIFDLKIRQNHAHNKEKT